MVLAIRNLSQNGDSSLPWIWWPGEAEQCHLNWEDIPRSRLDISWIASGAMKQLDSLLSELVKHNSGDCKVVLIDWLIGWMIMMRLSLHRSPSTDLLIVWPEDGFLGSKNNWVRSFSECLPGIVIYWRWSSCPPPIYTHYSNPFPLFLHPQLKKPWSQ